MDSPELLLARHLSELGLEVGRSKSGRLLRVDNRNAPDVVDAALLDRMLGCRSIRELYLRNVRGMLNARIGEIAGLEKLKLLDVEGSDLTDDSIGCLAECQALQVLNVRQTGVTEATVVTLRKTMINTRIIF